MTESSVDADAADADTDGTEAYADLGATTSEAMDIAETSMDIVRSFVPDESLEDRLRQKAVHATGSPDFQHLLRFHNDPVVAGARAVLEERPIVTDITMAKAGITGRGHDCEVRKAIGEGADLAAETGMTRTAASVLELDKRGVYDGAIAVVGNAPTAGLALSDCIADGTRPAVVVATPVGFVKATESRERVRTVAAEYGVPAVTNVGTRGGSGLAAALTNELIHVASDVREGTVDLSGNDRDSDANPSADE
jgi:precorrin-8X/cobalt-precorrin-8 methylmutase